MTPHEKSPAAPYPRFPRAFDVQTELLEIETELQSLRSQLSSLQLQRGQLINGYITPVSSALLTFVSEWRNVLSPTATIEAVHTASRARSAAAQERFSVTFLTHRISDFPQYSDALTKHGACLAPLFYAEFCRVSLIFESQAHLAKLYHIFHQKWLENNGILTDFHSHVRVGHIEWPPEFPVGATKPDPLKTLEMVAPDRPMVSKFARREGLFWDMNRAVEDPVSEHKHFKKRVIWTEDEKDVFIEAYMQHPKKFRMIARDLPGKEVKDVIEFYYLNRYALGLKEKEPASRRKGSSRVISEGIIKNR
jgi:hypothetical protein